MSSITFLNWRYILVMYISISIYIYIYYLVCVFCYANVFEIKLFFYYYFEIPGTIIFTQQATQEDDEQHEVY